MQGSDRLFQLDLTRRYAYGRLAEILGAKALVFDRVQRAVDISAIATRQLRAMAPRDRAALVAFSDGVNAAAGAQPLPIEFRILLYHPAPWTPKDSLAVSLVASLELADPWHAVFARDAVWRHRGPSCFAAAFPLSDARYDVTIDGRRDARGGRAASSDCDTSTLATRSQHRAIGSNAWAAGAARSTDGHALLANDPHLDLTIPGIWYLVDLQSPQVHAAGATIPGMPGVVLGHNENLAWASTNGEMATTSVFEAGRLERSSWVTERFGVRFAQDVHVPYYRTSREFSVPNENDPSEVALVRWPIYSQRQSTIATVLRARSRAGYRRSAAGARAVSRIAAELRLRRSQRPRRLARRRFGSQRSCVGTLRSQGARPSSLVRRGAVRAAAAARRPRAMRSSFRRTTKPIAPAIRIASPRSSSRRTAPIGSRS